MVGTHNFYFWQHNHRNKHGKSIIYLVYFDGSKRHYFSTGIKVMPEYWDKEKERVIANNREAAKINYRLADIRQKLNLLVVLNTPDAESVKLIVQGESADNNPNYSFLPFFDKQIKAMREPVYSYGTVRIYRNVFNKFSIFLQGIDRTNIAVKDVDYALIKSFEVFLYSMGLKTNTISTILKKIRKILGEAHKEGLIDRNPFDNISIRTGQAEKRVYLSSDELNRLYELYVEGSFVNRLNKVVRPFLAACYTGLRYSDVVALKWKDIESGTIRLKMAKKTKKGYQKVIIPLTKKAEYLIFEKQNNSDFVFDNIPTNQKCNQYLKEIAMMSGIDKHLTFHSSRHTFATISLSLGIDLKVVSALLGHSTIKTTEIYAHILESTLKSNMTKWDDL